MEFSDYIVYADESGDHSLVSINPQYPVFVLAVCLVHKRTYVEHIVPDFLRLKFEFWGHDSVVFHSHELRKEHGEFGILRKAETRTAFIERLNGVIEAADFTIIAAVIDKQQLVGRYRQPADPYEVALGFCMEQLQYCLMDLGQDDGMTYVQAERRGKAEDAYRWSNVESRHPLHGQEAQLDRAPIG